MTINLAPNYYATADTWLLGYVGETNSRAIYITNYTVDGCDKYRMRFSYSDGIVYETDIINSTVELVAGIMRMAGDVSVQICAVSQDGDEYTFVKKSNIVVLKIGNALDDNVAPVPTPDVSVGILENVQSLTDVCTEAKTEAQNAADVCTEAKTEAQNAADVCTEAKTEAQNAADVCTEAKTEAQNAADVCTEAKTEAQNAADVCTEAKTEAQNAADVCTEAKTEAQNAADVCTEAKIEAQNAADECEQIQADINESFELIETIITTETVSVISRTEYPDGTPYNFNKLLVNYNITPTTTTINGDVLLYHDSTIIYRGLPNNMFSSTATVYGNFGASIENGLRYGWHITASTLENIGNTFYRSTKSMIATSNNTVTQILIRPYNLATVFPVGTKIEIYGIRGD